jgi:hypothetical protein
VFVERDVDSSTAQLSAQRSDEQALPWARARR